MTDVKALQAGNSSQGTSEPITLGLYLALFWHAGIYMSVVPGWIFGVTWGEGGMKISLIINFMSISMQFLTILKTNSWAEAMFASIQTFG